MQQNEYSFAIQSVFAVWQAYIPNCNDQWTMLQYYKPKIEKSIHKSGRTVNKLSRRDNKQLNELNKP